MIKNLEQMFKIIINYRYAESLKLQSCMPALFTIATHWFRRCSLNDVDLLLFRENVC